MLIDNWETYTKKKNLKTFLLGQQESCELSLDN